MKNKVVKWITVLLQLGLLGVLFAPFIHDYELSSNLWDSILKGYQTGALADILTYGIYYVPVAVGILLVLLLESRVRYGVALLGASMGLALTLNQFLFPALANEYLFAVYQPGLYVLLGLQCAVILFSLIGICCKEPTLPGYLRPVDFQNDTAEIPPLPASGKKGKKGAKHMAK